MDLKWIETFIVVVEEGSFRAAAKRLYLSQPTITVHIQALEQSLGMKLFERIHTKANITRAAIHYYERAKQIVAQLQEAQQEVQQLTADDNIPLTIAMASSFAPTPLLQAIAVFQQYYARYDVDLMVADGATPDQLLEERQADVVLSLQKPQQPVFHSERLVRAPLYFVYATSLMQDAYSYDAQLRLLLNTYPLYYGDLASYVPVVDALENEYIIRRKMKLVNELFALQLVRKGVGVGLFPLFFVQELVARKEVAIIPLGEISRIYAVEIMMSHIRYEKRVQPFLTYIRSNSSVLNMATQEER